MLEIGPACGSVSRCCWWLRPHLIIRNGVWCCRYWQWTCWRWTCWRWWWRWWWGSLRCCASTFHMGYITRGCFSPSSVDIPVHHRTHHASFTRRIDVAVARRVRLALDPLWPCSEAHVAVEFVFEFSTSITVVYDFVLSATPSPTRAPLASASQVVACSI